LAAKVGESLKFGVWSLEFEVWKFGSLEVGSPRRREFEV